MRTLQILLAATLIVASGGVNAQQNQYMWKLPMLGCDEPPCGQGTAELDPADEESQPFMRWRHRFDFVVDTARTAEEADEPRGPVILDPGNGKKNRIR